MGAYRLSELAALVDGVVIGDGRVIIRGVAPLPEAGPGDLSLLTDPRFRRFLKTTQASAVLVKMGREEVDGHNWLVVPDPSLALAKLLPLFGPPAEIPAWGIHPTAILEEGVTLQEPLAIGAQSFIGAGSELSAGVIIGPGSYVGRGCRIGPGTRLHPQVTVLDGVEIGARCLVHSGAVLGSDGFGFATDGEGRHHKIPQLGGVVVEDEVEIGANATIDRSTLGKTRIGRGTKIDNLVQVAHNVEIGEGCLIAGQVGISGSVKIGRGSILAGQVGIADHVELGEQTVLAAQSGVSKSFPQGSQVLGGSPAGPVREWRRITAIIQRLPQFIKQLRDLQARLETLEQDLKRRG